MRDLKEAMLKGISASKDKEKIIREIDNLLIETNELLREITSDKMEFKWRPYSLNTLGALANIKISVYDVDIKQPTSEKRVLYICLADKLEIREDLTVLEIDINGFPCSMNVNGNKLIANNIEALKEIFGELFSSSDFGDKIRKLKEKAL